jgi:hypothetical protein
VAEAASLIRTGEVISCAIPLDSTGPVHPARTNITHFFSVTGADFVAGTAMSQLYPKLQGTDDYIIMPLQGSTQWDGLSHIGYGDTFYNGFWVGNVEQFAGAKRLGIHQLKNKLVHERLGQPDQPDRHQVAPSGGASKRRSDLPRRALPGHATVASRCGRHRNRLLARTIVPPTRRFAAGPRTAWPRSRSTAPRSATP